jgi:hypothetical protein
LRRTCAQQAASAIWPFSKMALKSACSTPLKHARCSPFCGGRVEVDGYWSELAAMRPLIAHVGLQSAGLGLSCSRRQHGRVVAMQDITGLTSSRRASTRGSSSASRTAQLNQRAWNAPGRCLRVAYISLWR